jgi:signal transduction histidine kinase
MMSVARRLIPLVTVMVALWSSLAFMSRRALAEDLPVLTHIREIRELSLDEAARGYPVRIRATITHFNQERLVGLFVHDGELGQFVSGANIFLQAHRDVHLCVGDLIEVEGQTIRGGYAPDVNMTSVRRLGRGHLPPPRSLPFSAMLTGRHDCEYVEVIGVGQRTWEAAPPTHTMFLELAVPGGTVRVSFWSYRPRDLGRFIDARVRVRGNVGTLFSQAGQLRGVALFGGAADSVVIEDPPRDPSALPVRPVDSLFRYSLAGEEDRRVRVQGIVTYRAEGRPVDVTDGSTGLSFRHLRNVLYLRDATSGVRVETEDPVPFDPGDRVDVVGFAAVTATKPTLRNATLRRIGHDAEPAPRRLSPEQAMAPEADGELVRMEGTLLGVVASPTERVLVLQAGDSLFNAALDTSLGEGELSDIRAGSRVAVTGVHSFGWGPPPSFRILLRSPADVVVLVAAPWWTLQHTLVMMLIAGLIASAATVWVRAAVKENILIRQQYDAILAERGRLARELHDTLEQALAGVKLQLEAVLGTLEVAPSKARKSLEVAREMLLYGLDEARRSIMDLRSSALEANDLPHALREMARQMTQDSALKADVRVDGPFRRLEGGREHHLLRIGLEALTNVVKHANARHVEIELHTEGDQARLVVRDDGCGFREVPDVACGERYGLRGIRERVDKLGGTLEIGNRPGGGAEVAVSVPLWPRRQEST